LLGYMLYGFTDVQGWNVSPGCRFHEQHCCVYGVRFTSVVPSRTTYQSDTNSAEGVIIANERPEVWSVGVAM
jgi:hypothetical protein